jgi:hypothetical protein
MADRPRMTAAQLANKLLVDEHPDGHCCIWRSLKPASSTRAPKRHRVMPGLIAFEHFRQPSGRETAPLCYPPAAPLGQMQQCQRGHPSYRSASGDQHLSEPGHPSPATGWHHYTLMKKAG